MRALSASSTILNTQNALDVFPKLTVFGWPTGPLHIGVARWFLTHCSGSGVGVGSGGWVGRGGGGGGRVGSGGGLTTPPHAAVSSTSSNTAIRRVSVRRQPT